MFSITVIIIIFSSIISFAAFQNYRLVDRLIYSPFIIYKKKQFYRFLSSGFIHADIYHLIFNMISLHSFGESLESVYNYYYDEKGPFYFLCVYFGGILFSDLPSFFKYKNNPNYLSLGASGGISAIIASYILHSPNSVISILGIVSLPSIVLLILYIMYVVYIKKNRIYSRTNHNSHIFGGIYGIIFNIILEPKLVQFFILQIKNMIHHLNF